MPHVCARFGPGGQLIRVIPNLPSEGQPALVEVHSMEVRPGAAAGPQAVRQPCLKTVVRSVSSGDPQWRGFYLFCVVVCLLSLFAFLILREGLLVFSTGDFNDK